MGMSRSEDILQAIIDGSDPTSLPEPQSRVEKLLFALLQKINAGDEGSGSGLSIHFCSADEYDQTTGVPTIENPSETTFYLVPTRSSENDLYDEWVYIEGNWERFGNGSHVSGTIAALSDTVIVAPQDSQALVYDETAHKWMNRTLLPLCFADRVADEDIIIFDSGSIDD